MKKEKLSGIVVFVLTISVLGILPIGRFVTLTLAEHKLLLLEWGIWIFVGLFFVKDKWLKSWFLWVLICLIVQYNRYSYASANSILLFILFYQILVDRLDNRKIRIILNGICCIVLVHILWMVLQHFFGIWIIFKYPAKMGHKIFGVLANANNAGMLVALSIPAFLRRKWFWLLPIVLGSIFLTTSIGAIVAATAGVLLYAVVKCPKRWRFCVVSFIVFLGVGYAFIVDGKETLIYTAKHRIEAWYRMIKIIRANPLQGLGLGQYRIVFPMIDKAILGNTGAGWFRAHNIYIELAFNQGVIGLGLMVGFVCSNIERFFKSKTELGFIALIGIVIALVGGFVHFIAQTSSIVIPIIYFAILVNQTKRREIC